MNNMDNKVILQAIGVTKRFEHPVAFELLKSIDISLYRGERVAIVGKSGEGKTTLLHILATLDTASSGSLSFLGKPLQNIPKIRNEQMGFVFQSFCLLEDSTVMENLLMPAAIGRVCIGPNSNAYKRALALLEHVGLLDKQALIAAKLSGGQMQRLAIARAFMQNPLIIFADEPTGNLDHEAAASVQKLLFSWVEKENKTLCLVTHDMELAKKCDRIFRLEDGVLKIISN